MGRRSICSVLSILLLPACALLTACTDPHAEHMARQLPEGMRDAFIEYYDFRDYKAFVMAVDPDSGSWAFGTAYATSTETAAKGYAMIRCKEQKKQRDDINVPCRLFAVGNNLAE